MNQLGNGQEKKLKNRSFMMRSDARNDFKIKKSPALDVTAIAVSVIAAFLVWVFSVAL